MDTKPAQPIPASRSTKPAVPRKTPGVYGPRPFKSSGTQNTGKMGEEPSLTGYRKTTTNINIQETKSDMNANPVRPSQPPPRPSAPPSRPTVSKGSGSADRSKSLGPKPPLKAKPSPTSSPKIPPRRPKVTRCVDQGWGELPSIGSGRDKAVVVEYEEEPRRLGRRIVVEIDRSGDVSSSSVSQPEPEPEPTPEEPDKSTDKSKRDSGPVSRVLGRRSLREAKQDNSRTVSQPEPTPEELVKPKRDSGPVSRVQGGSDREAKQYNSRTSKERTSSNQERNSQAARIGDSSRFCEESSSEKKRNNSSDGYFGEIKAKRDSRFSKTGSTSDTGSASTGRNVDSPRSQEGQGSYESRHPTFNGNSPTSGYDKPIVTVKETPVNKVERFTFVEGSVKKGIRGSSITDNAQSNSDVLYKGPSQQGQLPELIKKSSFDKDINTSSGLAQTDGILSTRNVSLKGNSPVLEDVPRQTSLDSYSGTNPPSSGEYDVNCTTDKRTSSTFSEYPSDHAVPRQRVSLKGPQQPILQGEEGNRTSGGSYSGPTSSPAPDSGLGSGRQRVSLKGPQEPVLETEPGNRTSFGSYSSSTSSPCPSPSLGSPRQRVSLKGPLPPVLHDEPGKRTSIGSYSSASSSPCPSPSLGSPRQQITLKGPQRPILEEQLGKRTSVGQYSGDESSPSQTSNLENIPRRVSLKGPQQPVIQDEPGKRTSVGSYSSPFSSPCPSPGHGSPRQRISLKGPQEAVLQDEQGKRTSVESYSSPVSSPGLGSPRQRVSLKGPQKPVLEDEPGKRTSTELYSNVSSSPCQSPSLAGSGHRVSLKGPPQPVLQDEPGQRTSNDSQASSNSPGPSPGLGSPRQKITLKGPTQPVLEELAKPDPGSFGTSSGVTVEQRCSPTTSPMKKPNLRGPPKMVLEDSSPKHAKAFSESPKSSPRSLNQGEPPREDIQVTVEKIKSVGSGERKREIVGMETFPAGTTANETCTKVAEKYGSNMGIWLLQRKVSDPENHPDVEDGCYVTVRNSKLELEQGQQYCAVYFSGSQMFIFG